MTIIYDKDVHEWLFRDNYPLVGGARFSWAQIKYFNLHYIGAGRFAGRNEIQVLNDIQNDYVTNRGYSFGYSSSCGLSGTTYEGRGEVYRAASNGDDDQKDDKLEGNPRLLDNVEVFSCLLIIGTLDDITPAMIHGVNRLYSQMPPNVVINGHRDLDWTPCPGDRAYQLMEAGVFKRTGNKVIDKFTILDPPDRFYDSRIFDDKQPIGPGVTTFGVKKYDGINFPKAVEVTVTVIPRNVAEGDGYVGVNQGDSFINWKASDIGRAIPQTVWLPVNERGEITIFSQDTIDIILSTRAFA